MKLHKVCVAILGIMGLSACQHVAPSKVVSVMDLFQVSTENVTFPVNNEESAQIALGWMKEDVPSSAQISCDETPQCQDIQAYLERNAIPYDRVQGTGLLQLSYQRVTAKECASGLGCSTARNTVQMVSDYSQFFNPALSTGTSSVEVVKTIRFLRGQE